MRRRSCSQAANNRLSCYTQPSLWMVFINLLLGHASALLSMLAMQLQHMSLLAGNGPYWYAGMRWSRRAPLQPHENQASGA